MSYKKFTPEEILEFEIYGADNKELNGTRLPKDTWDNIIKIHLPKFKEESNAFECGIQRVQN